MTGYINNNKKGNKPGAEMGILSKSNMSKSVIGPNSIEDDLYSSSGKDKKAGNKGF